MVRESVEFLIDSAGAEAGARQFEKSLDRVEKSTAQADKELRELERELIGVGRESQLLGNRMQASTVLTSQSAAATELLNRELFEMRRATAEAARSQELLARSSGTYGAAVSSVQRSTAGLGASAAAALAPIGRLVALVGAGFGARQGVATLAGFERTIATVGSVSQATEEQIARLRETALGLGESTSFTAREAGEGLLFLSRAGFSVEESVAVLPGVLDLATASALELGEAADIASNILSTFGLSVASLGRVNDVLVTTTNNANTDVRQLAEGLKFVGPIAQTIGVSLEETVAALGAFGDRGVQASTAGTALNAAFRELVKPSDDLRNALAGVGLSAQDVNPALVQLSTVSERIGRVLDNLPSDVSIFDLARTEGARGLALLAQSGDAIEDLVRKQTEAEDAARKAAAAIRDNLAGSLDTLTSALEGTLLRVGDEGLTGGLRDLTDGVTETIRKLAGLESPVDRFGAVTDTAATAVEVLGAALLLRGGVAFVSFLSGSVQALTAFATASRAAAAGQLALTAAIRANPIGLAVTAVASLAIAYRTMTRAAEDSARQLAAQNREIEAFTSLAADARRVIAETSIGADTPGDAVRQIETRIEKTQEILEKLSEPTQIELEFANAEEVERRVRTLQREIDRLNASAAAPSAQSQPGRLTIASPTAVRQSIERQLAEYETELSRITETAFTVDGVRLVSEDAVGDIAAVTNQLEVFQAAQQRGIELAGIDIDVIPAQRAISILDEAIRQFRSRLQDVSKEAATVSAAAAVGADPFEFALRSERESLEALQAGYREDARLIDEAIANRQDLSVALEEIARRRAVEAERRRLVTIAEQAGIDVEAEGDALARQRLATIEEMARARVAEKDAIEGKIASTKDLIGSEGSALNASKALIQSLEEQVSTTSAFETAQLQVSRVTDLLIDRFGEASDVVREFRRDTDDLLGRLKDLETVGDRFDPAAAVSGLRRDIQLDQQDLAASFNPRLSREREALRLLESRGITAPDPQQVEDITVDLAGLELLEQKVQAVNVAASNTAGSLADFGRDLVAGVDLRDASETLRERLQQAILNAFVFDPLERILQGAFQSLFASVLGAGGGGIFGAAVGGGAGILSSGGSSGSGFQTGGFGDGFKILRGGGDSASASSSGGGDDNRTVIINQRINVQGAGASLRDPAGYRRAAGISGRAIARVAGRRA